MSESTWPPNSDVALASPRQPSQSQAPGFIPNVDGESGMGNLSDPVCSGTWEGAAELNAERANDDHP